MLVYLRGGYTGGNEAAAHPFAEAPRDALLVPGEQGALEHLKARSLRQV